MKPRKRGVAAGVKLDDFWAYMPMHRYIFAPTGDLWPSPSVNSRLPPIVKKTAKGKDAEIPASVWLDEHQPVEQMTWCPGRPQIIKNRLISEGGWIHRNGVTVFNLYRPPTIVRGDAGKAGPWLDHVRRIYPNDLEHIVSWLASRVQRPDEKVNHALLLGGAQGIGKDTALEPVKRTVGPWNFTEVSPVQLFGRFNGFVKSVILRVSEACDLGDKNRYSFYEHLKSYTAAPPDVLRVDEKNLREYVVPNVCGLIITTNHKTDGIYLPADDRRHYVAWSNLTKEDFDEDYWTGLWGWYNEGGDAHVAAYLAELDISLFDPKAPPPQTLAFRDIVDANRAPEDAELADALDRLGNPEATTLATIASVADPDFDLWLLDHKNLLQIPHRLEEAGYVRVRNDGAKDGLFKVGGKRRAIYARKDLLLRDQIAAAQALIENARRPGGR